MENSDHQLIAELSRDNFQLKRLYSEHLKFEERLSKLERRPYLTTDEELEQKKLKRAKLQGVDRMMQIISVSRAA